MTLKDYGRRWSTRLITICDTYSLPAIRAGNLRDLAEQLAEDRTRDDFERLVGEMAEEIHRLRVDEGHTVAWEAAFALISQINETLDFDIPRS